MQTVVQLQHPQCTNGNDHVLLSRLFSYSGFLHFCKTATTTSALFEIVLVNALLHSHCLDSFFSCFRKLLLSEAFDTFMMIGQLIVDWSLDVSDWSLW